jgi:hypothetical protein
LLPRCFVRSFCSSDDRTAIISGPIAANLGWRWLFHIFVIFAGVQFVLMIFFCPEMTYHRDPIYDIDQRAIEDFDKLAEKEKKTFVTTDAEIDIAAEGRSEPSSSAPPIPAPATFFHRMKPWSKTHSKDNFIFLSIAPFVACLNIGALYTIVSNGILVMWLVGFSLILAQEFSPPPYLFSPAQVGYLSTGPAVGALLGCAFMAAITDPMIKYCSKRNMGIQFVPAFVRC